MFLYIVRYDFYNKMIFIVLLRCCYFFYFISDEIKVKYVNDLFRFIC